MRTSELRYDLPSDLIAQQPAEPRDESRLLVLNRGDGRIEHRFFREIGDYLRPGDSLVLNNTRVIPARFFCRRSSGGKIEAFFLRAAEDGWRVLLKPSARLRVGERLTVISSTGEIASSAVSDSAAGKMVLMARHERGEWTVTPDPPIDAIRLLETVGHTPLPPYIERGAAPTAQDRLRYQTVYAHDAGAVAAPTAGLHFTLELLERLAARGVQRADVTLHVGLGTFAAIDVDDLSEHRMHAEWYRVSAAAIERMHAARTAGGRIVAVGTTSARVLETLAHGGVLLGERKSAAGEQTGWTDIFIYPPYRFRNVDMLLTNFHLPESTLLALVMALGEIEPVRAAYAAAIAERYRFYSYGDAMLIV
jgi:S-adenosylmethionine:tRNA ribosyltransferase-isomerase